MTQTKSDDAVSPVIGVMLMLVITVVIAGVITVFATGVFGDGSDTTPMVMIDLGDITTSGSKLKSVEFIHKGGDEVPLEYIEIALVGSYQTITNYFPNDRYGRGGTVTVSGESGPGITAGAGDFIKLTITGYYDDVKYRTGEKTFWTMYDTRTNGIIASGDFVVP